ncbi:MAG: GNAT family N-acetyltransferase [Promethearchaeota archaeon]
MKIRKVKFRDLKKIYQLEQSVFGVNAFSKDLLSNLISNNFLFLKLVIGKFRKKIVGFIVVIKENKDKANIVNFLINPDFQKRGYGTLLLQKAIEYIRKLNEITKVILNVQVNNNIAIKLYEKFKFKKNPEILENYYQSGESAFLMELNMVSLQTKTYK